MGPSGFDITLSLLQNLVIHALVMNYQIPKALLPNITRTQDKLKELGLFKDKVNGNPALTTWEAVESSLAELESWRNGEPQVSPLALMGRLP